MDDEMVKRIGREVRRLRDEKDLSQTQLAARAGTSQSAISVLEKGKRSPRIDTLVRICDALGTEPSMLMNPDSEEVS